MSQTFPPTITTPPGGQSFPSNPYGYGTAFNYQFGRGVASAPKTAAEIVQDALEKLRVYAPGEDATSADLARGFYVLNSMLDSWSNESLTCYAFLTQKFNLIVGKGQYTIGPGGDIDAPRPLRLFDSPGSAYLLDINNNRYPMDVIEQQEWNLKTTATVNSDLPDTIWYDSQFPLGVINVWPTPAQGYPCFVMGLLTLGGFVSLDTQAAFPPGYLLAITDNLAILLKPYFASASLDPIIVNSASEAKANIKRTNMKVQPAVYDPELVARGYSSYNIYSDNQSRYGV